MAHVRRDGGFLVYEDHGNIGPIPDVLSPVVAGVKIERAVSIDIGQSES
jgi:hypothetical protein